MPTPTLDPLTKAEARRLKAKGYTHAQIADMLTISLGSVSNCCREMQDEHTDPIDTYAGYHKEKFEELKEQFNKWIGDTAKPPKVPKKRATKNTKAFAINDVHAPFHHEEALAEAIRLNLDADECWVVGDFLDLFNFSRYDKYKVPFSPVEEFQSGRVILRKLAETFPVVRVMHGNHDDRFKKWLVRDARIPIKMVEFFCLVHPGFDSPLAKMCADFPNIVMMEPKKVDFAEYPHFHQIGDCVLSHAERYSKVANKAVSDVIEMLMKKFRPMGVVSDFRVVGQAHTHAAGKTWNDYDVVGIEMGCLSRTPDYDGDPKLRGRKPVVGYTVFHQENGVTDRNTSNFIELR